MFNSDLPCSSQPNPANDIVDTQRERRRSPSDTIGEKFHVAGCDRELVEAKIGSEAKQPFPVHDG
jgi:hypothetical protein